MSSQIFKIVVTKYSWNYYFISLYDFWYAYIITHFKQYIHIYKSIQLIMKKKKEIEVKLNFKQTLNFN